MTRKFTGHQISILNSVDRGLTTLERDYIGANSWASAIFSLFIVLAVWTVSDFGSTTPAALESLNLSEKERAWLQKVRLFLSRTAKLL
mmetsp:Transcript_15908/g.24554  ORF Transcript_15908/g.24554 Transcript_15908/m.24554 type:complete len:88 (+) Transcript_15908:1300-1563(+)